MTPPADELSYLSDLCELGNRLQVYVKVSEVLRRVTGRVPADVDFYLLQLDWLWKTFGGTACSMVAIGPLVIRGRHTHTCCTWRASISAGWDGTTRRSSSGMIPSPCTAGLDAIPR
jgi:hypothetical protein